MSLEHQWQNVVRGLPLIAYAPRGSGSGDGGVRAPKHCCSVLHAKRGEGVQLPCKIAYWYVFLMEVPDM